MYYKSEVKGRYKLHCEDSGTHSLCCTQRNNHLHQLQYSGHVGEIDTSHGTKPQSQRGAGVSEGSIRCSRKVSCWLWAAEELPVEGVNHSSSHCCQESRDKDTPHTCPNQVTARTFTVTPMLLTFPSHFFALAMSHVQFQSKLFRNAAHIFTFIARCGYGYYCILKDP